MKSQTEYIEFDTKGRGDVRDVTADVREIVQQAKIREGIVTVSAIGSTAAVTTCEFEPGLIKDIPELFDKLIPPGRYHHDQTWHDGNGHSHLRSSVVGPSITIPVSGGDLVLGTWQQIVFVDFDNRSRRRRMAVQYIGQ